MTTKEAVEYLLTQGKTKYRIAMDLRLTPTSIRQYLNGTRCSTRTAEEFLKVYGITITDTYER